MSLKQFYIGRAIGFIVVLVLLGMFVLFRYIFVPKEVDLKVIEQPTSAVEVVELAEVVPPTTPYICNSDGKICPDGSTVGRTGSDCQFTACPASEATTSIITTTIGQVTTGLHVSITPSEIVSDSRCAQSVQCIWAGTVEVRALVATEDSREENIYKLGETTDFGIYTITLTEVTPYPKEPGKIPDSSYRFTFKVDKK